MTKATDKPNAAQKLREAMVDNPSRTPVELADLTRLGRSTVTKELAKMRREGEATSVEEPRSGGRGPATVTRWSLTTPDKPERLRAGGLDLPVLDYVCRADGPVGPTEVGKALNRSPGAVANCMARWVVKGRLTLVQNKPKRYEPARTN